MDNLPKDLRHDWIRFVDGRPSRKEITDWIAVKAAEIGWNWMDLSEALFLGVKKQGYLLEAPEPELNQSLPSQY